jgi:hypothetical protein
MSPNPRDDPTGRRPARRRKSCSHRPGGRLLLERLEDRLALSAYTWTGAANDGNWDTAGNWAGDQAPVTGSADITFNNAASAQTITLNGDDANLQVTSLEVMGGSYTLRGPSKGVAQPFLLADGASMDTENGSQLAFCEPGQNTPSFNSLLLTFQGRAIKVGSGTVGINNQRNKFPTSPAPLRPITIGSGTITVGNSTTMIGSLIQVDRGATMLVPAGTNPSIGSLSGGGNVEMGEAPGKEAQTLLFINTPQGDPDQFTGDITGAGGTINMEGPGSLTVGRINPGGSGVFRVNVDSGTLLVQDAVTAQTLNVSSSGVLPATFGGPAAMSFSGPVTFGNTATFAVSLSGVGDGQSTQLQDTDVTDQDPVSLGGTLSINLNYPAEQGDPIPIIKAPGGIVGQFTLPGAAGGVPFNVGYGATSVTLKAGASVTMTQLTSSADPSGAGAPVTLTATVSSRTKAVTVGSVTLEVGGMVKATVPVGTDGIARFPADSLPVGITTFTALFSGFDSGGVDNLPSSATLTQTTQLNRTTTTLRSSTSPSGPGQPVKFTATVTGPDGPVTSGSVVFALGGQVLATSSLGDDGRASLTASALPPGSDPITATYEGSAVIQSSSASLTQTVNPYATTVTLALATQKVRHKGRVYVLMVTVTAIPTAGMAPLPSGTVTFSRNNVPLGGAALEGGSAVLPIGRARPRHKRFIATFSGGPAFAAGSAILQT